MKKIIFTAIFVCLATLSMAQAKKPTLMVVPSDVWCNLNGYMSEFDNQGVTEKYPNYDLALQSDADLLLVVSKIGEMMAERGFPLKDLASTLKSLKQQTAEESVTSSKSGDMIAESPLDQLNKIAKADIIIQMTWSINKTGPKKSITFNLQGLDAYTNKQIAASSGTGAPSFASEIPILLEESVLSHIDQFNSQLQGHFDDLFENGREVSLLCKRWSGSDMDFESEVGDDELGVLIEDWVADNTVKGRFSTSEYSENKLSFEQVRIPLYNESGRAIDTRRWANGLRKYLKKEYQVEAKLSTKGLGKAIITLGEK